MNIILNPEQNLPIYEQIIHALKHAMVEQELRPGDMLPSIRALAKDLGISVITTKRAYEELEKEGLIYSVQGKGFYVKKPNREFLREEQIRNLEEKLNLWMDDAIQFGFSLYDMKEMLQLLYEGRQS